MFKREPHLSSDFEGQRLIGSILDGLYISTSFASADLTEATLSGTFLDVDFSDANLIGARLSGEFRGAKFFGADLAFCNLLDANIQECDLKGAYSLRAAVMPDGSRYQGQLHLPGD